MQFRRESGEAHFIRMPHPVSLKSRVSTKSNCRSDGEVRVEEGKCCGGTYLVVGDDLSLPSCTFTHEGSQIRVLRRDGGGKRVSSDVGAASMRSNARASQVAGKERRLGERPEANLGGN